MTHLRTAAQQFLTCPPDSGSLRLDCLVAFADAILEQARKDAKPAQAPSPRVDLSPVYQAAWEVFAEEHKKAKGTFQGAVSAAVRAAIVVYDAAVAELVRGACNEEDTKENDKITLFMNENFQNDFNAGEGRSVVAIRLFKDLLDRRGSDESANKRIEHGLSEAVKLLRDVAITCRGRQLPTIVGEGVLSMIAKLDMIKSHIDSVAKEVAA